MFLSAGMFGVFPGQGLYFPAILEVLVYIVFCFFLFCLVLLLLCVLSCLSQELLLSVTVHECVVVAHRSALSTHLRQQELCECS